jgi:C-terminal domain 7 of the ABC-three component (ABC-3C) systems
MSDHSAVDSTLGYAYQTLYALVVLLRAGDDESVSLELTDDVTLHHNPAVLSASEETRFQLAHSIRSKVPELKLNSTKLWKTLAIWADEYNSAERYFLVTCAPICADLQPLCCDTDRSALLLLLQEEAQRVIDENQKGVHEHKERLHGCTAFLGVPTPQRIDLLAHIRLCGESPNIREIDAVLDAELRNVARPERRKLLVFRLREYWMHRACLSLTKELPPRIPKAELQQRIEELAATVNGTGLPDDYAAVRAPEEAEEPDMMRRQIDLVNGGNSRIVRARSARWKSRNQRQRWMEDDVSMARRLNEFDQKLIDAWSDRHAPMCDDTLRAREVEKQRAGCGLLDWSHNEAPLWPIAIGTAVAPTYVTQGTYQDLADRLLVGWHPNYKIRLSPPGAPKCER